MLDFPKVRNIAEHTAIITAKPNIAINTGQRIIAGSNESVARSGNKYTEPTYRKPRFSRKP